MDSRDNSSHNAPSHFDDDLFTQSLTVEDDVAGFDRPWNPWSLVMLTFFFGVMPGIGLMAFNYQRLGIQRRLYVTLAILVLLEVLLTVAHLWAVQNGLIVWGNREDMRTVRLATRIVSVLAAVLIAQTQLKRFRLFQRSGLPAGPLLIPAVIAIAIGFAFDVLEATIMTPFMLKR